MIGTIGRASAQTTITWTGVNGNWGAGTSWVGGVVPTAIDTAVLNGAGTLTLEAGHTVSRLNYEAGTVNGGSTLTVNGAFDWTAGVISGPGVIQANGGGNWLVTGPLIAIDQRTLNLGGGTTTFTNALAIRNGAAFNVLAGATLNAGNGTSTGLGIFVADQNGLGGSISNAGTMRFNYTASSIVTMPQAITFTNSGTLIFQGGGVDFQGGLVQTAGELALRGGSISAPNSAFFDLQGGQLTGSGNVTQRTRLGNVSVTTAFFGEIYFGAGPLEMSSGTNIHLRLGTTSDKLFTIGDLTLDGTVNITDRGGFGAGSYTLIDYQGTLTNNGLEIGNMIDGYNYAIRIDEVNTRVMLDVTPVPEPTSLLGVAAIGLIGGRLLRHGRKRHPVSGEVRLPQDYPARSE